MVYLHLLKDWGVLKKGQVERFNPRVAEMLLRDGIAEPEKNLIVPPADKQMKSAPRQK